MFELDSTQKQAVELCCDVSHRIVSVTGSAGTGKTSIMRLAYAALTDAGYNVVLCAPTGKAAKRIQEATDIPARTIHRLLEYPRPGDRNPKTGKPLRPGEPQRHRMNPLDFDVVLADEYAMVSSDVHRNLVDALPRGGVIRMFGDVNQLPPIEQDRRLKNAPSPFKTMLEKFDSVVLTTIHRQDEGSGIVSNGALILKGQLPKRLDDFALQITDSPVMDLRALAVEKLDTGVDYSSTENQIISPTNKGWVGTAELNNMLQRVFRHNDLSKGFTLPRHEWDAYKRYTIAPGDKVIWTQNNYDLEVFNGETGIVTDITEFDEVVIDFGDRMLTIPPVVETTNRWGKFVQYDPRMDIDLAYCVTTHKAQGSEYMNVVYVLNRSSSWIQSRPNLYTAVTRARKHVHIISDQHSLSMSVSRRNAAI